MNGRALVPWRAALLAAALFVGLGFVATAIQPSPEDDIDVAVLTGR